MSNKVYSLQGEVNRNVINDLCSFIHMNKGENIEVLFMHTNIVLLEDYLMLKDILEYAKNNCKSAKAYFYGTLNIKHIPLMQSIDSTMGENSLMLIDKADLTKLKLLYLKDELVEEYLLERVQRYAFENNNLSSENLDDEDMLLNKQGCIEMGIIKE